MDTLDPTLPKTALYRAFVRTAITWEKKKELQWESRREERQRRERDKAQALLDKLTPEQQAAIEGQRQQRALDQAERTRLEVERLTQKKEEWEREEKELLAMGRTFTRQGWTHEKRPGFLHWEYIEPFQRVDRLTKREVTASYRIRISYEERTGAVSMAVEYLDYNQRPREHIVPFYTTVPAKDQIQETVRRFMMAGLGAIERDLRKHGLKKTARVPARVLARYLGATLKKPLLVFPNKDEGFEVHVIQYGERFHVVLFDTDEQEYFPSPRIYPSLERAEAEAKKIAHGAGPGHVRMARG